MAIIHPKEPEGGNAIIAKSLSKLDTDKSMRGLSFAFHPIRQLAHTQPHKVYTVGLNDLANGKLLSAAKETAWRYLLVADGKPVGEMELGSKSASTKGGDTDLEFKALNEGPFAEATFNTLRFAERLDSVARENYELRFLRIAAAYFAALWLHGERDDLIIPMGKPPGGLRENTVYQEPQVIEALRRVAETTKQFHESARSQ